MLILITYMHIKIILILIYLFINGIMGFNKPRLYTRIPQFMVDSRIKYFLNDNRITNCFEFRESPTNLLLKCWRENQLVNVNINIDKEYQRRFIPESISI